MGSYGLGGEQRVCEESKVRVDRTDIDERHARPGRGGRERWEVDRKDGSGESGVPGAGSTSGEEA